MVTESSFGGRRARSTAPAENARRGRGIGWASGCLVPLAAAPLWTEYASRFLPSDATSVSGLVLLLLLTTATVSDSIWRKIPNWATYPALLWAVALNAGAGVVAWWNGNALDGMAVSVGSIGLRESAIGALACFGAMSALYVLRQCGAGDVKLAAAVGALAGLKTGLLILCCGYIVAGTGALCIVVWGLGPRFVVSSGLRWAGRVLGMAGPTTLTREQQHVLQARLPLGPCFALGGLFVLVDGARWLW